MNSKFVFAVLNPPDAEKKGTTLATWPAVPVEPVDTTASWLSPAFEPAGNVAPVAAIAIDPVPSELIVAPPRLIVSPAKKISLNLLEALPKLQVPLPSGIISWSTADKSLATSPKSNLSVD